jgi:hypothetical protein
MGGKVCIRGMRVTVGMIVGRIGAGHCIEEILEDCFSIMNARTRSKRSAMPHAHVEKNGVRS